MPENELATGKCKECEHAIFCETFGEYKCRLYTKRIYFPDLDRTCYVPRKSDPTKCRCLVCEEQAADMENDD